MIERGTLTDEFVRFNKASLRLHYGIHHSDATIQTKLGLAEPKGFLTVHDQEIVAGAVGYRWPITLRRHRALPAAGIGEIAVLPSHRRRGLLRALLREHLRESAEEGCAVAVLNASEGGIYGRFGYAPVTADCTHSWDTRGAGLRPSPSGPAPGYTVDMPGAELLRTVLPGLFAAYQRATPGELERSAPWWRARWDSPEAVGAAQDTHHVLVRAPDGTASGYACWHRPTAWSLGSGAGPVVVEELVALDHHTVRALLTCFAELDLCSEVILRRRPLADPVRRQLDDPRRMRVAEVNDRLWARVLDVPAVAEACLTLLDAPLTLLVHDTDGRPPAQWDIVPGADGPRCVGSVRRAVDLELAIDDLTAVLLGAATAPELAAVGRVVEHTDGSTLILARALAASSRPHCSTAF